MTPQENDLITTLLTRLKSVGAQPKDPEAEALIRRARKGQTKSLLENEKIKANK